LGRPEIIIILSKLYYVHTGSDKHSKLCKEELIEKKCLIIPILSSKKKNDFPMYYIMIKAIQLLKNKEQIIGV